MMKLFITVLSLLISTMSIMAANFTITSVSQINDVSYENDQTIVRYQFKITNNLSVPLYLHDRNVSGKFSAKPTHYDQPGNCHFYVDQKAHLTPLEARESCIIEFMSIIGPSKSKGVKGSFPITLKVMDQFGQTIVYSTSVHYLSELYKNKHVLLIGMDGVRLQQFKKVVDEKTGVKFIDDNYKHFAEMINNGKQDYLIYAGGEPGGSTEQKTSSSPSWTTILTGVWANKHGITKNPHPYTESESSTLYAENYNKNIPTIFNEIKDSMPDAYTVSLVSWLPLNAIANLKFEGRNDAVTEAEYVDNSTDPKPLTDQAVEFLRKKKAPTFMFLHYVQTDHAGHAHGFGDNNDYQNAIRGVFVQIDRMLAEIDSRQKSKKEQWLVIIVTDHGGKGKSHGGQSASERQIFATFYDPQDRRYSGGGLIYSLQGQVTITPTILEYLGISIPSVVTGLPINSSRLDKRLFYVTYDTKNNETANGGYPQLVSTSNHWPGLEKYTEKITTLTKSADGNNIYFFLNDNNYISYNIQNKTIEQGFPKPIAEDWEGIGYPTKPIFKALTYDKGNTYYILFKDGQDIKVAAYDSSNNSLPHSIKTDYPKSLISMWPSLNVYMLLPEEKFFGITMSNVYEKAYVFASYKKYIRVFLDRLGGSDNKTYYTPWGGLLPYIAITKGAFEYNNPNKDGYLLDFIIGPLKNDLMPPK